MEIDFCKYEGAGNDFILIDGRGGKISLPGTIVRALCDRHRGIGADGLMVLSEEPGYDFRMTYYNSDGGEVNMCGNGGRCITLFADHLGIGGTEKRFIGRDGDHAAAILSNEGMTAVIELGLVDAENFQFNGTAFIMNTGVPHYIEFTDDLDNLDVGSRGREIRMSEKFRSQGGTNVNFVEVISHGKIKVRTYERGVEDETLACGTGAVASAIATHLFAQGDCFGFNVVVPGGMLDVKFESSDNLHFTDIKLTGPARCIFRGRVSTDNLSSI